MNHSLRPTAPLRCVAVARALVLLAGGSLAGMPCSYPPNCSCPAADDAGGQPHSHNGECAAWERDAGCRHVLSASGPLPPPELVAG